MAGALLGESSLTGGKPDSRYEPTRLDVSSVTDRCQWSIALVVAALLAASISTADASNRHHHYANTHNRHGCNATATWDCRSLAVKHEFWEMIGHPHGWKGHIVDHRSALVCGGPDAASNLQWGNDRRRQGEGPMGGHRM